MKKLVKPKKLAGVWVFLGNTTVVLLCLTCIPVILFFSIFGWILSICYILLIGGICGGIYDLISDEKYEKKMSHYNAKLIERELQLSRKSNLQKIDISDMDELFYEAASIIVQHQSGSTSLIQRKLKIGYNRAGHIIDQLEAAGIVGPFEGSKARKVLVRDEMELEELLKKLNSND